MPKKPSSYRRYQRAALNSFPKPGPNEGIMRVFSAVGGNLYKLEDGKSSDIGDSQTLYLLPKRLRHVVYVRKGSFVIAKQYEKIQGKVVGEITAALLDEHVKLMRKMDFWPEEFIRQGDPVLSPRGKAAGCKSDNVHSDDLDDLQNPNRKQWTLSESSSDDE